MENRIAHNTELEEYFSKFRYNVIGHDLKLETPFGSKQMIYADWIASGRMYQPIENILNNKIFPFVANTHTQTTTSGCTMTLAYAQAREIIKKHTNASDEDILISSNSGMTGVVNKFQRILGLRVHEKFVNQVMPDEKPLIICTHMEHHSNQTSWLETLADVKVIEPNQDGLVCLESLKSVLEANKNRKQIIAAVTSCSNVTGIFTPYYDISEMVHAYGGLCFVDFACSAPYIDIDMHPSDRPDAHLDAIFFSPHKFLGGPGSTGILIFKKELYKNRIPDNPGGGTVDWTNPWGEHKYHDEIEAREDGGTPAFLQTIRVGLSILLKDQMDPDRMHRREKEIIELIWPRLIGIDNLHVLADNVKDRLSIISFYIEDLHYNLGVKLLNDRFGIQVRGGCSCAGTYGHYLLQVSQEKSRSITEKISLGDLTDKPGWIRLSLHPIMTNDEVEYIADAIDQLAQNFKIWAEDYYYAPSMNEFIHKEFGITEQDIIKDWFKADLV
ncbi:MAG: aminotransferase class V-fold PLP-dependent enzyme [Saprospiraceae bacterium]|nr:aminotransferase class V-fold PLP-dependent enzyme [Saprospiraceae bacterium]